MTPVVGKFFGMPLEVRHVTLSTGSLALAGCTLGFGAPHFLAAFSGIGVMLALNFGVSFALRPARRLARARSRPRRPSVVTRDRLALRQRAAAVLPAHRARCDCAAGVRGARDTIINRPCRNGKTCGPLEAFAPATRAWFADAFAAPTPVQARGWAHIARGKHTLMLAPTGSGKTLAAFLVVPRSR